MGNLDDLLRVKATKKTERKRKKGKGKGEREREREREGGRESV